MNHLLMVELSIYMVRSVCIPEHAHLLLSVFELLYRIPGHASRGKWMNRDEHQAGSAAIARCVDGFQLFDSSRSWAGEGLIGD